jgi:DNA-binding beta-propeller fold protein YncE
LDRALAWLNTDRPLRIGRELRGQVVLLDFWTYCCINCMHVLPDLEHLERRFAGRAFVVIGVHSAKFANEAERRNVRAAVQRYGIAHPVALDDDLSIWRSYGVRSWPTRILIDPEGYVAGSVPGEGHLEAFENSIERLLDEHAKKGTLAAPLTLRPEGSVESPSGLRFPGKVLADRHGGRVFVADSGHHRIVVARWPDEAGRCEVERVVGSGTPGLADGVAAEASFRSPQGMALARGKLYVADTENHAIRAIDLHTFDVSTFAGTGAMTYDRAGGHRGAAQGLNSPWDLAIEGGTMYVAMAGLHQVWRFELGTGMGRAFAGSGRENLTDGAAEQAALAQPSGLALRGNVLYVADSETSSIRGIDLAEERVFTVIGEGLFDFGDVDGHYPVARLQHPLGVAAWQDRLFVADSYNHKVKMIDPETRSAITVLGDGEPGGMAPGGALRLAEPGGLSVSDNDLMIADTNNHRVVWAEWSGHAWRELAFESLAPPRGEDAEADAIEMGSATLRERVPVRLLLDGMLPADGYPNAEAPLTVRIRRDGRTLFQTTRSGAPFPIEVILPADAVEEGEWRIEMSYAYCTSGEQSLCVPARASWRIAVSLDRAGAAELHLMASAPIVES